MRNIRTENIEDINVEKAITLSSWFMAFGYIIYTKFITKHHKTVIGIQKLWERYKKSTRYQFINIQMIQHRNRHLLALTICVILAQQISSQILAIDFGTQYIKAAIVHSGAGKSFQIVENHKSERKFYNAIGFYDDQRHYETSALSKRSKLPTNCFLFSRLLVDFMDSPETMATIKKELLLEYVDSDQPNQLMAKFLLKNFPADTQQVTFMDIFAMILKHVKMATEKFVKTSVKDTVIVVPSHWNLKMREFILSAAEVVDLYVLSLISENTAASLNYALNQRKGNKTQTVMFYNVGANSLQMSLVEYRSISYDKSPKPVESIFVIGDYGKSYLGGLKFNSVVAKYFEMKFEEKYKKQLTLRAQIKLLSEATKVKEILSSNKEANIYVQGIMDGIDYYDKMTRREFEELSAPLFKQLTSPIKRFLLDNDMKPSDIKTVELIGGSVRIPKLQSLISEIIGKQAEVGTHINGDEAMALGAAFYAANSSKKFKVKGVHLYDGFNFQIHLVIRNLDQSITQGSEHYFSKDALVFKKKTRFGTNKEVTFRCKENIIVELIKKDDNGQELLRRVEFSAIDKVNETEFKISFTLNIDPVHIVTIKDSKILYKRQEVTSYLEKIKKEIKKGQQGEEPKTEEEQVEKDQQETDAKEETDDTAEDEKEQQEGKVQDQTDDEKSQETKRQKKKDKKKKNKQPEQELYETVERSKNVTKKYEKQLLKKETFSYEETDAEIKRTSKRIMKRYEQIEEKLRKLLESKNRLQSTIYEGRDRLQNPQFLEFIQSQEKEHLSNTIAQQAIWLDETMSNQIEDYKKHFDSIHKPMTKIKRRMTEYNERDLVKSRALEQIQQYSNLAEKIRKDKSWIADQQIQELRDLIQTNSDKIEQIYRGMVENGKNQDLVYRNKDFLKTAEAVKDRYFAIKATPKPKEEKKEKTDQEEKEDNEEL